MRHRTPIVTVNLVTLIMAAVALQLFGASPTHAATIEDMTVTCQSIRVRGRTDVSAPFVQVQVVLASDLTQVLAVQTVTTQSQAGAKFDALLSLREAHLAVGTRVVVTAREWDGFNYLLPAFTISGADCGDRDATPVIVMPTLEASSPYLTLTAISPTPSSRSSTLTVSSIPATPVSHASPYRPLATGADCSTSNAATPTMTAKP